MTIVTKRIVYFTSIIYYHFSFPVDKTILEKYFLEGKTFDDCYKEDRLFYINYKDLEEYVAKASNEVSFLTSLGTVQC